MRPLKSIVSILGFLFLLEGSVAMAASSGLAPGASLNGGIGTDEQQAMQAARGLYNLRLIFATVGTGAFIAGIPVMIEDIDHPTAIGIYQDSGPLLYLHLDPGTYRVSATYGGQTQIKTVRISKGAVEQVFYWPDRPSTQNDPDARPRQRHHKRHRTE